MSRYRPAISIRTDAVDPSVVTGAVGGDTTYDAIASKVEKYSITPRTLKAVTEFDPAYVVASQGAASSVASALAYNPELYTSIEEYSYASNNVVRYSIRSDLITPDPSGAILGEGNSGPRGPSMKTAMYNKSMSQAAILHSLEKDIITRVITSFISAPGIITAIVDIFERNMGVAVNVEAGHPITHSVVLHFTGSEVCVIDPSNFLFSSHLENNDFTVELGLKGLPPIRTIHKELKIYTPIGDPGYTFDRYRDCTDVAVKLAFSINVNPIPLTSFTHKDIVLHDAIMNISNNNTIDKSIVIDKSSARVKQASSQHAEKTFSILQSSIDFKIKMCTLVRPDLSAKWKIDFNAAIQTPAKHENFLNLLTILNSNIDAEFGAALSVLGTNNTTSASELVSFTTECSGLDPNYYDY